MPLRYHVKAGDEPPLHTHSREDEMVYVVEGEITAIVGDSQVDVGPGAFAALPRGVAHTIKVKGDAAHLTPDRCSRRRRAILCACQRAEDEDPAKFGLQVHT